MKMTTIAPNYRGYRFPPEIISHAVWLYFRFSLNFRDIEELLAERGIAVTSETIRQWTLKSGQTYTNEIKRRRGKMGDKWYAGRTCISKSTEKPTIFGELLIRMCITS